MRGRRRRCSNGLFYFTLICLCAMYISYFGVIKDSRHMKTVRREVESFLRPNAKYRRDNFLSPDPSVYDNLIINTSSCKVPALSEWETAVIPFAHKAVPMEDCMQSSFHWSYRDGRNLVLNDTAMIEDDYEWGNVACCFKEVTRVEQTLDNYDLNAESIIKYSDCRRLNSLRTQIDVEFIVVECYNTGVIFDGSVVYRGYHGFAQPQPLIKERWQNSSTQRLPNILVIGTDTTSRLNFRRNMPLTMSLLKKLGAIEMKGYTKAGESTHAAFVNILTGYNSGNLDNCRIGGDESNYDMCPLIWKRLKDAGYLTAHSEDWPDLNAFNHGKAGFVHQPTHHYIRTLMNAAHDFALPPILNSFVRLSTVWCLGHQTNDELLLDYTESVISSALSQNIPFFAWSWSSTLPHHHDHNLLQLVDPTYSSFLEKVSQMHEILENTLLIFVSDHGQRFGPLRETLSGWYEDRMPNLWIRLPERIVQDHPEWLLALETNSQRLTSPFMLHNTLNKILDYYSPNTPRLPNLFDPEKGTDIPKSVLADLLTVSQESWGCPEVGVPSGFCPCYPLKRVKLEDSKLREAGRTSLKVLQRKLPLYCADLDVGEVTGGALMDKSKVGVLIYIIGFRTNPGQLLLEAQIEYHTKSKQFKSESSSIIRADKIDMTQVRCTNDGWVQQYCLCK